VDSLGRKQEKRSAAYGEKTEEKKSQGVFTESTILFGSGGIVCGLLTAFVYRFCFGKKKYYNDIESLRNDVFFFS
jgi:hypothetical protein